MKVNSTKTKIRSTVKKVLKASHAKKSETISISVNTRPSLPKYNGNCNIRDIAKTLKSRLSNVAKRFVLDNKSVSLATAPMVTNSQQITPLQINTTATTPLSLDESLMESLSPLSIQSSPESPAIQTPPPMLLDDAFSLKQEELSSFLNQVSAAFPTNSNTCCSSPLDLQPISPAMLATADWSNNTIDMENGKKAKVPSLYNLHTLKQYLTFISQETEEISLENGAINLTVSNDHEMITSTNELQQASRLGATLIELSVHDPSMKIEHFKDDELYSKHPNQASRNNRRRPGRPPKSIKSFSVDKSAMKTKRDSIVQRHQQRQQQKYKKDSIDCICNLAHEEFGTMVQCDDCLSWLHLDCLELDEKALEETFRCPSCFIKFGNGNETEAKLLSTVTWRYAAKYQSEVLATNHSKDDDEEEDYDDMDLDESEVSLYSYSESASSPLDPAASVAAAVIAIPPSMFDIHSLTTPVEESYNDWCDGLSSHDGYSEAGTPSDSQACSDDYWFAPPSAANVFLWENNVKTTELASVTSSIASLPDIEPSAVCAQELPTFNNYFLEASF